MPKQTMLITGVGGFMGPRLFRYFRDKYNVWTTSRRPFQFHEQHIQCDLGSQFLVQKALVDADINPDIILHFAAVADPRPTKERINNMIWSNIEASRNLFNLFPNAYIINASSIVVHGDCKEVITEDSPISPSSFYGTTKWAVEQMSEVLHDQVCNLRLTATVGPGLTHGVIKAFVERLQTEEEFYAIGNAPGSIKPYIHIDDVCSAIDVCLKERLVGPYNVCTGHSVSIQQVAHICMKALGKEKEIEWRPDLIWGGDNKYIYASNKKLCGFGWRPRYTSSQAITKAIKEL